MMDPVNLVLIVLSIFVITYNGLNLGVDFKGGTLIEIRTENKAIHISEIRQSLLKMNLGDKIQIDRFELQYDGFGTHIGENYDDLQINFSLINLSST